MLQQVRERELLKRLVGEWSVGIAMKTSNGKVLSGCGTMTAKELPSQLGVNSEIDMHIEGLADYFESDLWSFDQTTGKLHLFSLTSQGESHDHIGEWKDEKTLELNWKGQFENEDLEEKTIVTWISNDQIEVNETDYFKGEKNLNVTYVFKRKEP
jgi:hypothetical protein